MSRRPSPGRRRGAVGGRLPVGSRNLQAGATGLGTRSTVRRSVDGGGASRNGSTPRIGFDLPTPTLLKVVLLLVGLWLLARLWSFLVLVVAALLLTAALDPLVTRLERRGWPRARTVALLVVAIASAVALIVLLVVPPLVGQGQQLVADLPGYLDRARGMFQPRAALSSPAEVGTAGGPVEPETLISGGLEVGANVIGWLTQILLVITMAAYLLVDGERVFSSVVRFLPLDRRAKVRRVLPEISRVVSGYLIGQCLTSLLFAGYVFAALTLLGVPQAFFLALLAAVADAIPIVGVLIATAPAVVLALTVSPASAGVVVALYLAYQLVENYVIVPRVYRGTLRISSFAVLVAVAVGAQLFGIIGALLALPVAAAIPGVERAWQSEVPERGSGPRSNPAG